VVTVVAISAALGLIREMVIAGYFGTSAESDVYFFSFALVVRLPQFLLPAVSAALIPVYVRLKGTASVDRFASTVVTFYAGLLLAVNLLILVGAPLVVAVLGSGFAEELRPDVTLMIRLLSPAITFLGTVGVLKALLEGEGRFFAAQVQQVFVSLGAILAVVWASDQLGILSLPLGLFIGGVVQVGWMAYWVARSGFKFRLGLTVDEPAFLRFRKLLVPGLIGAAFLWAVPLIDATLSATLPEGSVSALSFASRPVDLLTRVAIHSLGIAGLPVLAWKAAGDDPESFGQTVDKFLRAAVFVLVPISMFLIVLRIPVIRFLYERGEFLADSTEITALTFAALAAGIVPMALAVLAATVFNSLEDTKTTAVWGAGVNLVVKGAFSFPLMAALGVVGLALSTSAMYLFSAAALLLLLRRRAVGIAFRLLALSLVRMLVLASIASVPVLLVTRIEMPPILTIIAGGIVGSVAYLGLSILVKAREIEDAKNAWGARSLA
jgi:putative peptidoglycan lipid II flippase